MEGPIVIPGEPRGRCDRSYHGLISMSGYFGSILRVGATVYELASGETPLCD